MFKNIANETEMIEKLKLIYKERDSLKEAAPSSMDMMLEWESALHVLGFEITMWENLTRI